MIHTLAFRLVMVAILATMLTMSLVAWFAHDKIREIEVQTLAQTQASRVSENLELLNELQASERPIVLRRMKKTSLYFIIGSTPYFFPPMFNMPANHPAHELFGQMLGYVDNRFQVVSAGLSPMGFLDTDDERGTPKQTVASLIVRLGDGSYVWVGMEEKFFKEGAGLSWFIPALVQIIPLLLMIGLTLFWVLRPLRQLARAADAIGQSLHATPPMPTSQLHEIAVATRALTTMQDNLKVQFDRLMVALGSLSHDLRTPLQRLSLRAEMIDDDEVRQSIHRDVSELNQRVEDGLFYLRTRGQNPRTESVHLPRQLRDWIAPYQEMHKPVTLTFTPPNLLSDESAVAKLHSVSFARALTNIIDNALFYGQSAEVSLARSASSWRIMVRDRGPGIPPEEQGRVFEPFVRLDASRNAHLGGSGMGLSIAKGVLEQHGGKITLTNVPQQDGSGLIVTLELPVS